MKRVQVSGCKQTQDVENPACNNVISAGLAESRSVVLSVMSTYGKPGNIWKHSDRCMHNIGLYLQACQSIFRVQTLPVLMTVMASGFSKASGSHCNKASSHTSLMDDGVMISSGQS